ncbi:MAG: DUF2304 domain-containing protein [Usitatibacter sp.]
MKDYHLTVLVIGFGLAYGILHLVRRDHLYIRQGVFWIVIAFLSLTLAIWPGFIDMVGGALGIAYPPTLLFLVAIVVLVVKSLLNDIALTKVRRDLRRLNQRIALLETHEPLARDHDESATARRGQPPAAAEARRVASS